MPKRLSFQFRRPQQVAAVLLLLLLAQCLWVAQGRARVSDSSYVIAESGTAQNTLSAHSTLAYRLTNLTLAAVRGITGPPQGRLAPETSPHFSGPLFLVNCGFIFFGLCLGAALWWVTRRLYGNRGGFIALALYCFSPPVIQASTFPGNDILAAFGLFAAVYTVMGVAHAMQGPRRKWRPRIVLFTLALAFTAAASIPAFLVAILLSVALLAYLAVGRRSAILPVLAIAITGAALLLFASFAFQPDAFAAYIRGEMGGFWVTSGGIRAWLAELPNAAVVIAAIVALIFYCTSRRSRYFGNTLPLLVALGLFFLATPDASGGTTLWALPFLFAFIAGVFADVLDTEARRVFSWAAASVLALEVAMTVLSLPGVIPFTAPGSGLAPTRTMTPDSAPAMVRPEAGPWSGVHNSSKLN